MRVTHRGDHTLSSPRVVIYSTIVVATLVPPVYLFVRSFLHRDATDAVVAVVCGVLYLLMLSRLWDVASFQRRAWSANGRSGWRAPRSPRRPRPRTSRRPSRTRHGPGQPAGVGVTRPGRGAAGSAPRWPPARGLPGPRDHARGRRRRAVGRPAARADRAAAAQPGPPPVHPGGGVQRRPAGRGPGRSGRGRPALPAHAQGPAGRRPAHRGARVLRPAAGAGRSCRRRSRSWPGRRRWRSSASRSPRRSSASAARRCSARWCGHLRRDPDHRRRRQDRLRHPVRRRHLRRRRRRGQPARGPGGPGHAGGRRPGHRPDPRPASPRARTASCCGSSASTAATRCSRSGRATCAATRPSAAWCSPCAT